MHYNKEAEEAVLGGLIIDNDSYDKISHLNKDDFYIGFHQEIFSSIQFLLDSGKSVDIITLSEKTRGICDISYLSKLESQTPSAANIEFYADIVIKESKRRKIVHLAANLSNGVSGDIDELLDNAQSSMESILAGKVDNSPVLAASDMTDYINKLEAAAEGRGKDVLSTGYADLDKRMSGGLRGGDLIILAGRPGLGKSMVAQCIALNVSKDKPVLFLSQEMARRDLHHRSVANLGNIPMDHVLQPKLLTQEEWGRMPEAVKKVQDRKLFIDDQPSLRIADVRQKAKAVRRKHGLSMLVVDYLQLMIGEGQNRNLEVEGLSRGLKALSMELDIPIIILSQLNRGVESRDNKRPLLSDLRDSGSIEADATAVMLLYRDEYYYSFTQDKGIIEVNLAKIRQGSPGVVGLRFDGRYQRISNLQSGVQFGQANSKPKPKYSGLKD